ncbi:hypothetical protein [Lottiidibacillus patelloidae]|nr:hypothetical protein [Lottiidibacillus patelloidae]
MRARKRYCTACGIVLANQPNLLLLWSIPVITTFLLMMSTISYSYFEEYIVLDRVQKNIDYGEALALQGNFEEAKKTFIQVKIDQPYNELIEQNLELINEAINIEKSISLLMQNVSDGSEKNSTQKFSEIEKEITNLKSEPIRNYFLPKLQTLQVMIELQEIEARINDLNTMTDYAELLSNISYYKQDSAKAVKEMIEISFTNFVINEAQDAVFSKDYEKAKAIVEFALQYNYENEQLSRFMENSIQPYLNNE